MRYKFIWGLIFLLHGPLDTSITYFGLKKLGSQEEANPIMRYVFELNPLAFVIVKMIVISLVCFYGYRFFKNIDYTNANNITKTISKKAIGSLYILLIFMGLIAVIGNLWVMIL